MKVAGMVVACAAVAAAQDLEITRSTIDNGGAMTSTGGGFELSGTIGQPDAGVLAGGAFEVSGGFWFAEGPIDCNSDGLVNRFDYDDFEACLSGPAGSAAGACLCFDVDESRTVDLADFAMAQTSFTGP